jgi:hypothetical protein
MRGQMEALTCGLKALTPALSLRERGQAAAFIDALFPLSHRERAG